LRVRMGTAGRRHVANHYHWESNVLQMHRVYQAILKTNSASSGSSSCQSDSVEAQ
jgi:hypothetical protein